MKSHTSAYRTLQQLFEHFVNALRARGAPPEELALADEMLRRAQANCDGTYSE